MRSVPVPSSSVNCSNFFDLGTSTQSLTFTARKSDLLKVSKSTSSSNSGSIFTLEKSMAPICSSFSLIFETSSAPIVAAAAPALAASSNASFAFSTASSTSSLATTCEELRESADLRVGI